MALYVEKPRVFEAVQYTGANIGEIADFVAPVKVEQRGDKLLLRSDYGYKWVAPTQYIVRHHTEDDEDETAFTVRWPEDFEEKFEPLANRKA